MAASCIGKLFFGISLPNNFGINRGIRAGGCSLKFSFTLYALLFCSTKAVALFKEEVNCSGKEGRAEVV